MFGEKKQEYSTKQKATVDVWQSPKYEQSKDKAMSLLKEAKYGLKEGDFWILMNETKSGKMAYTGLIISHNACLKINDGLDEKLKFLPSCVTIDKDGFKGSLVYSYCNDLQGIYEVGEVSANNCKNEYPYAMAYKRLFDRVVLKNSKIAYDGIYSDSEADEFKEPIGEHEETKKPTEEQMQEVDRLEIDLTKTARKFATTVAKLTAEQVQWAIDGKVEYLRSKHENQGDV